MLINELNKQKNLNDYNNNKLEEKENEIIIINEKHNLEFNTINNKNKETISFIEKSYNDKLSEMVFYNNIFK